jgi:hypothetical protein
MPTSKKGWMTHSQLIRRPSMASLLGPIVKSEVTVGKPFVAPIAETSEAR